MMPFQINMTFEQIPNKPQKMKTLIDRTIAYAADKIELEMKAKVPVASGRLQGSIRQGRLPDGRWVGPNTPYDIYVEFGTGMHSPWGAHMIYPTHGEFMVWTNKAGQKIFARRTRGAKAQPYVRPALTKSRKPISSFMAREYRKIMKPTKVTKT
jgi:HK97 gp10 family phage protein